MLKELGYKHTTIEAFRHEALTNPGKAGEHLKKLLAGNRTQSVKNDPNALEIDLSPEAKKWFRFKPSKDKEISNSGGKAIVQAVAESPREKLPIG